MNNEISVDELRELWQKITYEKTLDLNYGNYREILKYLINKEIPMYPLDPAKDKWFRCSNCGFELNSDVYCDNCGQKINWEVE